ncbi:sigma-E processing peptidase SpoIIGA [Halobacillus fulvus]|nr:sigma-E processing peptidase SpoIIGA [Halobacillus fulvus]
MMDAMILNLTIGVTKVKASRIRLGLGAFIASTIVPLSVYYPDSWLVSSWGKVLFSLLIIWVAFSYSSLRKFLMQWISFYFITFAMGGSMLGVHYFLSTELNVQGGAVITFSGGYGDPVSWLFVVVGFPCSYLFTKWRLNEVAVHKMKLENIYNVTVEWNGKVAEVQGMIDSGNQLIDPVSRKMVFLADGQVWQQLIDRKVLADLTIEKVVTSMDQLPEEVESAVRLVPYQAAGISGQLLVTLLVDAITIETTEGPVRIEHPLLGVQQHDLTSDRSYQVLIHPHVMIKGKSA